MMMRQLHFSMLDLELHARYTPGASETVFDRDQALAKQTRYTRDACPQHSSELESPKTGRCCQLQKDHDRLR